MLTSQEAGDVAQGWSEILILMCVGLLILAVKLLGNLAEDLGLVEDGSTFVHVVLLLLVGSILFVIAGAELGTPWTPLCYVAMFLMWGYVIARLFLKHRSN